jgi:hypothetical protein
MISLTFRLTYLARNTAAVVSCQGHFHTIVHIEPLGVVISLETVLSKLYILTPEFHIRAHTLRTFSARSALLDMKLHAWLKSEKLKVFVIAFPPAVLNGISTSLVSFARSTIDQKPLCLTSFHLLGFFFDKFSIASLRSLSDRDKVAK